MKLENIPIVIILVLVVESQCGLIDNIYNKVKNTTTGLKQDASNVFSYGKRLVGIEEVNDDKKLEEQKPGLIGGMIQTTRSKLHSIRDYFWNSNELSEDKGLFGNMFNRVKNRVLKIKGSLFNENKDGQIIFTESENTKLVRETMNKIFFSNGTRQLHGKAFQDALQNLRKKLRENLNNSTENTTRDQVHHGEGIIDVRSIPVNVNNTEKNNINNIAVNNDIYDKVDDTLLKVNNKATEAYNDIKDSVQTGVHVAKDNLNKGINELAKAADTSAKENNLLDSTYKKLNKGVKITTDQMKKTVDDINPASYN